MCRLLALATLCGFASGQSNYVNQSKSIFYEPDQEGVLPALGILNGTVTDLETLPATIMLKKTKAVLNCSAGFMNVDLEFNDKPFYGIVYADFDRNSACKIIGDGAKTARIRLPLKGCGSLQVRAGVNILAGSEPLCHGRSQ